MENESIKLLERKQYKNTDAIISKSVVPIIPNSVESNYKSKYIESHIVDLPYPYNNKYHHSENLVLK